MTFLVETTGSFRNVRNEDERVLQASLRPLQQQILTSL